MLGAIANLFRKRTADAGNDKFIDAAVSYLDASQRYGKRPDFDHRKAVAAYSSWVYVAANLNAFAVASTPLRLYVEDRNVSKRFRTRKVGRNARKYLTGQTQNGPSNGVISKADGMRDGFVEVVDDHPLTALLKRANGFEDGFQQAALRIIYGELTGNAYLHPVIGASGVPEELWTMPAQWVEILPSRTEFLRGYRFGSSEEIKTDFLPDEVIHFKRPNPSNLYYGKGKVDAGWWIIEQNAMIHVYDDATYRNMARPDYLLSIKGAAGKTQLDRFQSEVENRLQGSRKGGKFLALTGDVDLKPLSFPPKDLAGREDVVEEIAAIMGVPVSLLKANDPNLASAKVGHAQWRSGTILPLCRMDEETLNARLLPLFDLDPDRAFLAYDNPVPADEAAQVTQVSAYISAGVLTRNEARTELGYEAIEGGDVLLVPSGYVPIDHAIKPPQPPPDPFGFGRMPPDGDSGNPRSGGDDPRGRGGDAAREDSTGEAEELPTEPAGDDDQPRKRARLSGAGATHRRGGGHAGCGCQHAKRVSELWEKAYASPADEYRDRDLAKMEALLSRQADAVGRLLTEVGAAVTIAQVQEILMQPAFVAELGAALDSLIGEAIRSGAQAGAAKLPESIQFDTFTNERVAEAARARSAKLAESLGRRTAERVASSVAQGLKEGRTIDDIAGGIRQAVGDPARAVNIARTETARAYSAGQEAAWKESGVVVGKHWLLAPDPCEFCEAAAAEFNADTAGRKLGEPFYRQGHTLTGADGGTMVLDYDDVNGADLHPLCVLPDTVVETPRCLAAMRAFYRGEIVELSLSNGARLAVTPHHKMLTATGFVEACRLSEGDDLLGAGAGHGVVLGDPDEYHMPAKAKDRFEASIVACGVTTASVPVAPKHLHGDGEVCEGKVDVVSVNSDLMASAVSKGIQLAGDLPLCSVGGCDLFDGDGDLATVLVGLSPASYGFVCPSHKRLAIVGAGSGHSDEHRLGSATLAEAEQSKVTGDGLATDASILGQSLDGLTANMARVKVLKVDRRQYSGHVFDFTTYSGLYVAAGTISGNCRCDIIPILESDQ